MNVSSNRALAVSSLVLASLGSARGQQNYDRRVEEASARALAHPAQRNAIAALEADLASTLVRSLDGESGVTRTLYNPAGYLTEPSAGDPEELAIDFVRSESGVAGTRARRRERVRGHR